MLAIDLTGNGFSHVVPGGGATAAALRFRLFGRAGTLLGGAVSAAALQSAITTLWLVAAFLVGLIVGYWALDAACPYLCVLAYGVVPNIGGLLATYTLVSLIALLPLTPGGLGLVEGVAVPALVSFGVPHDAALLGVLTWRLFQFWIPIRVALLTYLWLRFTRHR